MSTQTEPFSSRAKRLRFESLSDGSGYAFDYATPSGVKLLSRRLFSRLRTIDDMESAVVQDESLKPIFALLQRNPNRSKRSTQLTVWLHVINGCNFACHYCYIPHIDRIVDREEIEKYSLGCAKVRPMLNGLLEYCRVEGFSVLHIRFSGGEPTLNIALIEEFCREANGHGTTVRITFGMISNGSFDAARWIPLLIRYQIRISLSADGFEESHDRIRFEFHDGEKLGSWRQLLANVDALMAYGISPFFLYTITPENIANVSSFAQCIHEKRLGFRLSLVRSKDPFGPDVQRRIGEEIVRVYERLAEDLDVNMPIPKYAAFAEWDLYQKKNSPCSSCRRYFAIDADGNVATCQMRMDRTYGRADLEPFSEIVSRIHADPDNTSLSNPETRQGGCVCCEYYHVCAGGCPQHKFLASAIMDQPSPWCQVFGTVLPAYLRATARHLQRAAAVGRLAR